MVLATWLGIGRLPVAPGTWAALTAWPIHKLMAESGATLQSSLIGLLCIAGVWSAQRVATIAGKDDPQIVVIDEVVGTLLALALVTGHGLWAELAALALFRVLDILKPWPIHTIECWRAPAGRTIMADDIAAGVAAGLFVRAISAALAAI